MCLVPCPRAYTAASATWEKWRVPHVTVEYDPPGHAGPAGSGNTRYSDMTCTFPASSVSVDVTGSTAHDTGTGAPGVISHPPTLFRVFTAGLTVTTSAYLTSTSGRRG